MAYIGQGVNFDGTNDDIARGGALTGGANVTTLTLSLWFNRRGDTGIGVVARAPGNELNVTLTGSDVLQIEGENSSGVDSFVVTAGTFTDSLWHHLMLSVDMDDVNKRHCRVDDVEVGTWVTYEVGENIDLINSNYYWGQNSAGGNRYQGDLADPWVHTVYIDLSIEANRRKFIGPNGGMVDLGLASNGDIPTGTSPIMFFAGPTADWHTNKGTGGGFTENGALTDAATNPPSEPDAAAHFVRAASNSANTTNTVDATLDVATTLGNRLAVAFGFNESTTSGNPISGIVLDPGGGDQASFTAIELFTNGSGSNWVHARAFLLKEADIPASGSFTVRATKPLSGTDIHLHVVLLEDMDQGDVVDTDQDDADAGDTTSVSVTTAADDAVLVNAVFNDIATNFTSGWYANGTLAQNTASGGTASTASTSYEERATAGAGTVEAVAADTPAFQIMCSLEFAAFVAASGRIMGSLAGAGGLAGPGGIAGRGGGLAG